MGAKFLPVGTHTVCIIGNEVKDGNKGKIRVITLQCIGEGDNFGARHVHRMAHESVDARALDMAQRYLSSYIVAAAGLAEIKGNLHSANLPTLAEIMHRPFLLTLGPSREGEFRQVAKIEPCPLEWLHAAEHECEKLRALLPTPPKSATSSLVITTVADVETEEIDWLWPERFALGKLHVIAGEPGQGKSQFTLFMAAQTTYGGAWPNGEGCAPQGDVIILACEDDVGDTIKPRLQAVGANLGCVHVIKAVAEQTGKRRGFSLQTDIEKLEAALDELRGIGRNVRLIIIDPISAYMGDVDTHKEAAVRAVLDPVSEFAARHDVAIVAIAHPPKIAAGGKAVNAVTGAKAFVNAARAAWCIGAEFERDKKTGERIETGRVLFLLAKKNIGRKVKGLAFRVEERDVPTKRCTTTAPYVEFFDGEVAKTADDLF